MELRNVQFLNAGYCSQWSRLAGSPNWKWSKFFAVFVYFEHPNHGPALIDTGYAEHFFDATRALPGRGYRWVTPVTFDYSQRAAAVLGQRGIAASEIRSLFVSHFHADHIAGLRDFSACRFIYRRTALQSLLALGAWSRVRHGFLAGLLPTDFETRGVPIAETQFVRSTSQISPLASCDYFGDGSLVLVDLPGHAEGHTGFVLRTERGVIHYIVDAAWYVDVMLEKRPLPWLGRRFQHDYRAYLETQEALRQVVLADSDLLLACHCPRTQGYVANPAS